MAGRAAKFTCMGRHAGERGVLTVAGDLDIYTAPRLRNELLALMEAGARFVIVDLSEVHFIDSTALGVLLGGLKRVNSVRGRMLVVLSDPSVRQVFTLTRLHEVFTLCDTFQEAEAALAAPAV